MNVRPLLEDFLSRAQPGSRVPVWCEFLFDADTAVTAYHKLKDGPFGFLLESVVGGERWARYSFLGSRPRSAWKLERGRVSVWEPDAGWTPAGAADPWTDLSRRLAKAAPAPDDRLPRFWGGAVGYFGYDLVRSLERLGPGPPDDQGLPAALVLFSDVVVAIDNLTGRAKAVATVDVGDARTPGALAHLYRDAAARLEDAVSRLRSKPGPAPLVLAADAGEPAFASNLERADFCAGVRRIQEYVAAGDAFQVVLSQRLATRFDGAPFDLYRALRTINPSPYLYHLDLDGFSIVGSSPEVLARLENGVVTVRPIAGTRPRGRTDAEDAALAAELGRDEKELAEHRMLVDLGRNDVGRVSEYGSVSVPELMEVERYSHVMHLCSRVEGRARSGLSALDVLAACFPAGTVTGAPKVRAMEIIDELEPTARGPYAGAVGYVGWGGRQMDAAITIRTMVLRDGQAHVQAGAGVVADSDPEREYEETLSKARALLRAVSALRPPGGSPAASYSPPSSS